MKNSLEVENQLFPKQSSGVTEEFYRIKQKSIPLRQIVSRNGNSLCFSCTNCSKNRDDDEHAATI